MDYLKQLVQELKKLEQEYSELSDMRFLRTSEDNKPFKQKLIEAGKLLIDFYDKRFVPQYSQIPDDAVEDAGKTLLSFSQSASYCLDNQMYYAISFMLANIGRQN